MNGVVIERVFGKLIYQLDVPDELIEDVVKIAFQSVVSSGEAVRCALYAFDQKTLDAGMAHTPRRSRGTMVATEIACESRIGNEIADHVLETASRSIYASKPIWCDSPCGGYVSRYFPILATSETAPSMSFCSNMPKGYISRLGVLVITFTSKVDIEWNDTSPFKRMMVCYMLRHLNSTLADTSSEVHTSSEVEIEVERIDGDVCEVVKNGIDIHEIHEVVKNGIEVSTLSNLEFFLELAYATYHTSLDESQSHAIPKFLKFFYQLHLESSDGKVEYVDTHMIRECIRKTASSPFTSSSSSSSENRKKRKDRRSYVFTQVCVLERVLRLVTSLMLQSSEFGVSILPTRVRRKCGIADYIDVTVSGTPIFPRDRFRFTPTYILNAVERVIKDIGGNVSVSSMDSKVTVSLRIPNGSREMSEVWRWSNVRMPRRSRRIIVTVISTPEYTRLAYDVFDVACQWGCQVRLIDTSHPHSRPHSHPKPNEICAYVFDSPIVDGVVITQHTHIKTLHTAVKRLNISNKN